MKVGLFFGSFNPIHLGHLIIAESMVDMAGLDQVWLIVSPQSPFKEKRSLLSEVDRLYMCELALQGNDRVRANNIEFALPKPSYTVDTLTALATRFPRYSFSLIMGADNLTTLHKWKNYRAIVDHYPILVYPRVGEPVPPHDYPYVTQVPAPIVGISATDIRQRLAEGHSVRYLLADSVIEYIHSKHLYGT